MYREIPCLGFITETEYVYYVLRAESLNTANSVYIQSSWRSTLVPQIVLEEQTEENRSFHVVLMWIEFILSSPGDISCNHNNGLHL